MTLARFRSSPIFRNANLLALMAMLLLALMPVLHHPAAMAGSLSAAPICHISMKDVGGKSDPHSPAKPACPICQALGSLHHGFVTPVVAGLAGVPQAAVQTRATYSFAAGYDTPTAAWPRAPPFLA